MDAIERIKGHLAAQPVVGSVIAGATRSEQVEANANAIGWALDTAELAAIDRITGSIAPSGE